VKLMEVCVIRLLALVFRVEGRLNMQHDTYAKCTSNVTPDKATSHSNSIAHKLYNATTLSLPRSKTSQSYTELVTSTQRLY